MEKIQKIRLNTRISEVNGLVQQLIDEYKKSDYSSDSYLTMVYKQLSEQNTQLGIAIKRDSIESELAELDDVTDSIFTLLHGLVKGYTCHPDEAISGPAIQLFKMIDKYGLEVKSKSYREEYPLLSSMITDSKTEPYAACITTLVGCNVRFSQLETAVDNFNAKKHAYYGARDDRQELETASVIKKRLINLLYDDVTPYLYTMQKVNAALYSQLAQFTANRIAESNAIVRNRSSKVVVDQ